MCHLVNWTGSCFQVCQGLSKLATKSFLSREGLFWSTTLRLAETPCVYESLTIWWRKAQHETEYHTEYHMDSFAEWSRKLPEYRSDTDSPELVAKLASSVNYQCAFDRFACIFYEGSWGSAIVVLSLKTFTQFWSFPNCEASHKRCFTALDCLLGCAEQRDPSVWGGGVSRLNYHHETQWLPCIGRE